MFVSFLKIILKEELNYPKNNTRLSFSIKQSHVLQKLWYFKCNKTAMSCHTILEELNSFKMW